MPHRRCTLSLALAIAGGGLLAPDSAAARDDRSERIDTDVRAMSTAAVDTGRSIVRWRGTKFGGRGAHAGIVRVRHGVLDYDARRGVLRGGVIELDMRSIAVTDMPRAEVTARGRLLRHLLATDFFDVDRHPTARFVFDRVTGRGGNLVRIDGQLTLRGVTRPFGFEATIWSFEPTALHATARATLDRMQWGVAFHGSALTNDLVDDAIHLEFDLAARVTDARNAP